MTEVILKNGIAGGGILNNFYKKLMFLIVLKPVAGRAVYSHTAASSSAVPSPALCPRPQNAVTPEHYPMAPLRPNGGPLSSHTGTTSITLPFRGQFMNHVVQMSLPPRMPDG
uniref:Bm10963 n=1 Tax=Brugia malayi TaxID=6279 RepID=A0A1I9G4Z7_BRUMA|nr:Bm10963 [Brugia malayi]